MIIRKRTRRAYLTSISIAFAVLALWTGAAHADTEFFVAPAPVGNDQSDCLGESTACSSFQRAVDVCPTGSNCKIAVAPGEYSLGANVYHYKFIQISGPRDRNGKCVDRGSVIVDDRKSDPSNANNIFWAQDHATLIISCMTLRPTHSNGLSTRQFAIGDANDINFLLSSAATGVVATETSKINLDSPSVEGAAQRFAYATDLSQVTFGGRLRVAASVEFQIAFLASVNYSIVNFYPTESTVGANMRGASFQCVNAMIKTNTALPGGNNPFPESKDCDLSGIANAPSGITKISTQLEGQNQQFDTLSRQFDNFSRESAQEFDALAHENARRREIDYFRFGVIAVLISAISLSAAVTAFYGLWKIRRFARG